MNGRGGETTLYKQDSTNEEETGSGEDLVKYMSQAPESFLGWEPSRSEHTLHEHKRTASIRHNPIRKPNIASPGLNAETEVLSLRQGTTEAQLPPTRQTETESRRNRFLPSFSY